MFKAVFKGFRDSFIVDIAFAVFAFDFKFWENLFIKNLALLLTKAFNRSFANDFSGNTNAYFMINNAFEKILFLKSFKCTYNFVFVFGKFILSVIPTCKPLVSMSNTYRNSNVNICLYKWLWAGNVGLYGWWFVV